LQDILAVRVVLENLNSQKEKHEFSLNLANIRKLKEKDENREDEEASARGSISYS
jgi:hypothetical protein